MYFEALKIIRDSWLIWLICWIAFAFRLKKMQKREPASQRLAYILLMFLAVIVQFAAVRWVFLNQRFVPPSPDLAALGAALTVAGIVFSLWARVHIGQYWSGSVALREGHRLIRTGPYARIRHPIYTGILLALVGTTLALGTIRSLGVFLIVSAGLVLKAKREEALLRGEFGPAFDEHRRHTGFFLPRFS